MAAYSSTALQVADLFNVQAAEAPIHRLVSVLNAQASEIRQLQESLRLVQTTQQQTLADCRALHVAVSSLDPRIQESENDVSLLNKFRKVALSQFEAINRQLQVKADRQEMEAIEVRVQSSSKQLEKELRTEFASASLVQHLQTEQSELHKILETVDQRLATKMDKSEAARLNGMLAQIHSFRPMATQLSSDVESLLTQQKQVKNSVAQLDSKHKAHQIDMKEIRQHTNKLQQMLVIVEERHHDDVIPHIQRLDEKSASLQEAVNACKTTASTSEAASRALLAKLRSSVDKFDTQLQQQYRHFEHVLREKAPRLETEAQLADLSHQVALKTPETAHKALSSSVKDLRVCCEKLQKHVELSTRFMDWFARRGEAYEHNLELVETQLGRLAQASHPQSRDPFGGRVRFPRSP